LPLHLRVVDGVVDALGVKSPFSCSTCWRWARSTFPRLHTFVVGIFVIVRRYASSSGCRWAHLSSFGAMRRRWVVTGPYSSLLGLLVGSNLARTRRRCWAHSPSLGRGQGLLVVIGMSPGPASGLVVVGLSYSSSLGLRSFILASFVWPWLGWAGRVLFDALVLGETLALSI